MLTRVLCGAFIFAVATAATAQPRVDLALLDGTVITVDGRNTVAQAIAIGGGVPIKVGNDVIGGVGLSGSPGVDEPASMPASTK